MKHFSLLLLNRSWLAVLFFLFLPGVGLSPLASVQPAEKDSQTIQTAPTVPGDLDPTFGNQGLVQADLGGSFAVQLDGKMLVAGSMNGDFALARYNPDGSLDTTFGNDSRVTTDFYGKGDAANTVAIQPDGKILVAGSSVLYTDMYDPSNNSFFALARYYPGGEFEKRLHSAIAAKVIALEGTIHAIGGIENHIHLAVSVPPKISLARFIGEVKGNTSHFVNHIIGPGFDFYWQEEYGVVSFSEKDLRFVVRYVSVRAHNL